MKLNQAVARSVSPLRLALRIFALFLVIYLCTWGGHYTSGDGSIKVAWTKAMLGIPEAAGAQGGVYSKYGIGHSLLAIPPIAAAYWIQKTAHIRCEGALYTLMFIANGSLFLAMLGFYLAHFFSSSAVWRTVLICGLATIWWPYTKLDFSEPLVLTIGFLGFLLMRFGYPFWGMAIAGFTLAIRLDSIAFVAPLALWFLFSNRSVRNAMLIAASLAPAVGLILFANYIRYNSLLDRGYPDEGFSNPLLVGLYGILFSAGKSIVLFSPPLLLGALGWRKFTRRAEIRADGWLFLGICVFQILLFAKWWDWSSDDAWGVRFLIPGVLLMCIPLVAILDRRLVVIPVVTAGVLVQLLAVTMGGLDYLMLIRAQPNYRRALYVDGRNRIDLSDIRFNPRYSQLVGNWILLRYAIGLPPGPGDQRLELQTGTRLSDAIPAQAWEAAARWDFIWSRRARGAKEATVPSPQGSAPGF